jgi:3-hydroxyisobutyrate dehydrogenase-like beta-hydroxyacid dehydrogenase
MENNKMNTKKIGFIGLGIMGSAISNNLFYTARDCKIGV